jgi:hypothetical protein
MIATALLLLLAPARAGCDQVEQFVARAEQAVLEDRLEDAGRALRDVEVAFSCGPVVDPDLLVRFWLAQGARETLLGDVRAAALAFRSASMLAPDHWPVDYGIKPFIQYKAASELWLAEGSVQLHPDPGERITALDGELVSFPAPALEGLHLVQVGAGREAMEFASIVRVQPDEPTMVLTGLPAPGVAEERSSARTPRPVVKVRTGPQRTLRAGALVVGGSAALLAGGGVVLTRAQDDVMRAQGSQEELDAVYARQQRYAAATWGLTGLSVLGLTVGFAL